MFLLLNVSVSGPSRNARQKMDVQVSEVRGYWLLSSVAVGGLFCSMNS